MSILRRSALALALLTASAPAAAQSQGPSRTYVRGTLGVFAAFPDDFSQRWCEEASWGASVGVGHALSSAVALEAGLTVANGLGTLSCAVPDIPAPLPGSIYGYDRFEDGIRENAFRAGSLSAVLTPWTKGGQAVHARIGGAWMFDKRLFAGVGGFSYVFRLGRHEVEAGYEAWLVQVPYDRDLIQVTLQGDHVLLESHRLHHTGAALLLSFGYRYRVP